MATDIIPQSYPNLDTWLDNLKAELQTRGTRLGLTGEALTKFVARLDAVSVPVKKWVAAQKAVDDTSGQLATALEAHLPEIRREIKHMKTSAAYTDGDGEAMRIVGSGNGEFDPEGYRPTLTAEAFSGYVRIKGSKGGVKSMNIYTRLKGQPGWKVAIARRSKFPWDDDSALAQPGVPETREYRAIGVLDDKEIGQPSDIVEVVYAG